jgi:hypothetical protein
MKLKAKSSKTLFVKLFVLGLTGIGILVAPCVISAQTLEKAIAAHIEKVRADATEYEEARKIVYGDIDGSKDAVVQYTLEGFGGGNSWGQSLAVFLNRKGVYRLIDDTTVGGKFFRSFTVEKVVGKEIIGTTETCPKDEPQGLCKNPAKQQIKYILLRGKLKQR